MHFVGVLQYSMSHLDTLWRSHSVLGLFLLPFLRCEAFGCPCMYGGDLNFQCGIDQPMPRKARLLRKQRRNNDSFESLATATCSLPQ